METALPVPPRPARWLRKSELGAFVPAYWQYLVDRRYALPTQQAYLRCIAHFARWMTRRHRAVGDLNAEDMRRFLDDHLPSCTCPEPVHRCRHVVRAALHVLLIVLRDAGTVARDPVPTPVEAELRRFDDALHRGRGLATITRFQRVSIVRHFLQDGLGSDLTKVPALGAPQLRRFLAHELRRWRPSSARVLTGALRSYVRFRIEGGDQLHHLLPAILSPANWRLAALPQTLSSAEIAQILSAFPPEVSSARRGYAIVRCVVDLGLRSCEVVALELGDLDWYAGTIIIRRSKSRRADLLPLPETTGHAIAAYLQSERPSTTSRRVFVRHRAPFDVPIGPDTVRRAVRGAYRRCGLSHTRVHVLRHTLAKRLLDTGGTLKDVADILRHRDLDTSLIYAKVDVSRLASVAMPWPTRTP